MTTLLAEAVTTATTAVPSTPPSLWLVVGLPVIGGVSTGLAVNWVTALFARNQARASILRTIDETMLVIVLAAQRVRRTLSGNGRVTIDLRDAWRELLDRRRASPQADLAYHPPIPTLTLPAINIEHTIMQGAPLLDSDGIGHLMAAQGHWLYAVEYAANLRGLTLSACRIPTSSRMQAEFIEVVYREIEFLNQEAGVALEEAECAAAVLDLPQTAKRLRTIRAEIAAIAGPVTS